MGGRLENVTVSPEYRSPSFQISCNSKSSWYGTGEFEEFTQLGYLQSSLFNESVGVVEKTRQNIKHHDAGSDELVVFSLADVVFCVGCSQEDTLDLIISHLVGGLVSRDEELSGF